MGTRFEVGQQVMVYGHGLATITERQTLPSGDVFVITFVKDSTVAKGGGPGPGRVPLADADAMMRPVLNQETAAPLVGRLCDPTMSRGELPEITSFRAVSRLP